MPRQAWRDCQGRGPASPAESGVRRAGPPGAAGAGDCAASMKGAPMKFGLFGVGSGSTVRPEPLMQVAQKAEALGYESVWILTGCKFSVAQRLRSSAQIEGDRIRQERGAKKNAWDSETA